MAGITSPWSTLRFRRSKDVKGWALLGIPQHLYPDVMQPLFERQTRFIEKHGRGEFVNVLFEAPVALAARLALAFPAPPGCEPLVVNQAGNRLLYGKFAQSTKARHQAQESDAWPGLKLLAGDESFWQVVTTLSSVTTLPLDRLHPPNSGSGTQTSSAAQVRQTVAQVSSPGRSSSAATALQSLAKGGLKLQPAADLPSPELASVSRAVGGGNLDEEGFEDDDWQEEEAAAVEEETFDDIWDTEESEDFWGAQGQQTSLSSPPRRAIASSQSFGQETAKQGQAVATHPSAKPDRVVGSQATTSQPVAQAPSKSPPLPRAGKQRSQPAAPVVASHPPISAPENTPPIAAGEPQGEVGSSAVAVPAVYPAPTVGSESQQALQPTAPQSTAPQPTLGRYRSGLMPHPSDVSSLQIYNSGGLTIADAIARSRLQEQAAIAQQSQRRRIQLPFEQPSGETPGGHLAIGPPGWSHTNATPQLPEESWAATAAGSFHPAWDSGMPLQLAETRGDSAWDSTSTGPQDNPWLSPGFSLEPDLNQDYATADAAEQSMTGAFEAVDWGYYDVQGNWVPCDPVTAIPLSLAENVNGELAPAPTDIVCMPEGNEEHRQILLQGAAVWNEWRRINPHIRPNLCGAYLNNLDLAGADLHDVDLRFAFLFRADLRGADLSLASLLEADLIRADLAGASLWGAALGGAYLSHANLAEADLTQADLRGVYWQGAILTGAIMPDGHWFEEQS